MSFTSPSLCAFGGVWHVLSVAECLGGHLIIQQLDSYCARDIRNRRHLPQSTHAHAQSFWGGLDPWPLRRIQDLPSLIPHCLVSLSSSRHSTSHHPSYAPILPR